VAAIFKSKVFSASTFDDKSYPCDWH